MSYHKKQSDMFYKVEHLTFYKSPNYGKYRNTFILDQFKYNDIPKHYKLGYVRRNNEITNNEISITWQNINILEKILKRKF